MDSLPVKPSAVLRRSESYDNKPARASDVISTDSPVVSDPKIEADGYDSRGTVWSQSVSSEGAWDPCYLTLDGGGIRSFTSLLILRALMHEIHMWENRLADDEEYDRLERSEASGDMLASEELPIPEEHELLPCHYFDFFFGTSSGGLIATLLGRFRMTVNEAVDAFLDVHSAMYSKKRMFFPLTAKYDHRPMEDKLLDILKSLPSHPCSDVLPHDRYANPSEPSFDADQPRRSHVCCLTAVRNRNLTEVYLLRTYPLYHADGTPEWVVRYNEGASNLSTVEVIRATTALPFYTDAVKTGMGTDEDGYIGQALLIDGSVRENNPSGSALSEFQAVYHGKLEAPAALLSIGAGRNSRQYDGFASPARGRLYLQLAKNVLIERSAVIQSLLPKYVEGERQHQMMMEYARGDHTWYKRLNVVADDVMSIQLDNRNPDTLSQLAAYTAEYLNRDFDPRLDDYASPRVMLRQTAQKLVLVRRARERMGGRRWDVFAGRVPGGVT